jgi:hypothetical protein
MRILFANILALIIVSCAGPANTSSTTSENLAFRYTTGPDEIKPGRIAVYGTLYNRGTRAVELLSETCDGLTVGMVFDSTEFEREARIQCFANWPVVLKLAAGDSMKFTGRLKPLHPVTPRLRYKVNIVAGPYNADSVRYHRLPALNSVILEAS